MNSDKTIHFGDENIIPSGAGSTEKGREGIISSGLQPSVLGGDQIISSGVQAPSVVGSEIILNNEKYVILRRLGASGEAEVFLANRDKDDVVLKIYYPKFSPKMEVMQKLKGLFHSDIIAVMDYGYYQNRFVEVVEYAKGGSLYDVIPIRDPKRLKQIVSEVVNALHFCHSNGVIHRDIKPQNIFFRDASRSDVVVGDFGISSVLDEGFSKHFTGGARTTIYAAPELFQNFQGKVVIDKAVDYYALGITLIHVWAGEEPFKGLGDYGMMRMKLEGKVKIPEDMPSEFQTLIKGLITVNPSKRWGYDEVQRWLRGEVVPVEYEGVKEYPPFIFSRIGGEELVAIDPPSLADLMEKDEELGKRHLYKKTISEWLKGRDQFLYTSIESIVEDEYPKDQQAGLIKAIYILDPYRPFKGVDGKPYETREEIAQCLEANFSHYKEDLKRPNSTFYLYLEAKGYKSEADKFRDVFKKFTSSEAALNTLILLLEGGDKLRINGYIFQSPQELLSAPVPIQKRLVDELKNPYSKLSLWLQRYPELTQTIQKWRSLNRFDFDSFRYALNEGVVVVGNVVKEMEDVKRLLKEHPELFDHNVVKKVNYWLRYYKDKSFNEMVLEVMKHVDKGKILVLASCALCNYEDHHLDIFETLKQILIILKARSSDLNFSSQFIVKLGEEAARSIKGMVQHIVNQRGDPVLFLERWLEILEIQVDGFWDEVASRLPEDLFVPLAQALDDNSRVRFGEAYKRLMEKLLSLKTGTNLRKKVLKEQEFIQNKVNALAKSIKAECQSKRLIVEKSYTELIQQRKDKAKEDNKNEDIYEKMGWSAVVFVISIIVVAIKGFFLDFSIVLVGCLLGGIVGFAGGFYFIIDEQGFGIRQILIGLFVGFFTSLIGVLVGAIFGAVANWLFENTLLEKYRYPLIIVGCLIGEVLGLITGFVISVEDSGGPIGSIIAAFIGSIIGAFVGALVGALVGVLSPVIALGALVFFLVNGYIYRRAISKAARLTPEEESARRESLDRVDEYYREMEREERAKLFAQAILEVK